MFLKKKSFGAVLLLFVMFCISAVGTYATELSILAGTTCNLSTTTLDIGSVTNAGTLQSTTGTLNVGGNWTNSGTFDGGTGLVKFTGTNQTVSGASTFYNFTCASAGSQLNFEAGKTQTISATWTLTGSSGNLVKLRSTSTTGTQWKVDPKVTRNISYVDVKDSNNINSTVINPTSSTDSGNNTNWFSTAATPTPTPSGTDTTAPSGSVSINSGSAYTNSTSVTLTLSATDSVGVTAYYVSTNSSTPTASASGWSSVTSATSYSGSVSYTLASGEGSKTVYVWYKDAAGNVSGSASDSITLDTTAPIVTITSPTSDPYTATSSTVSLEGSASDSTSGVKEVTWSNDKGGSGTASGTTYWSVSSISLSSGENKITVTAKDNAGNTSTDTITVTYSASTKPTVLTGSATNVTATSATLTGTVNANGLSTTAWFEYGTVKGTYGSKSSTQTVTGSNDTTVSITITGLTEGTTYYYRIAAQNNSGTSYGSEMPLIYSAECNAPTVTTESATNVTSATATLNATVNANSFSTTAWFEYGKQSGVYGSKSDTKEVTGSTDTKVSISIKNLTSGTTYYFRIVAQNCGGTTYGEMEFYKSPGGTTATPTPNATAIPTPPPIPTQTGTPVGGAGSVYGYVKDAGGSVLQGVDVSISGSAYSDSAETNNIGYYEFENLASGSYTLTYEEDGYETQTRSVSLGEGEAKDLGTVILEEESGETPGSIYGYVVDIRGEPIESVRLRLKGLRTKVTATETSDADGYFEFAGLKADTYVLTAKKKRYRNNKQKVTLEDGESEEIEIEMRKTTKKIKGLFLMDDGQ